MMKYLEKLKKKREINKAKQKYFKKHEKRFFFITSFGDNHPKVKRGLKISLLGILPICLIGIGSFIGLKELNKSSSDSELDKVIEITETGINRRVYLLSKDNDTVPLTINLNKMNSIHEEILTLFNLLKIDSEISSSSFKGVIPNETRLVSFTLEDGTLSLNLSKEFLEYEEKVSKEKLLNSITYTMIQFDEVDNVELLVDDELFISELDETKGINVDRSYSINHILGKKLMTYFYEKEIDGKSYYLPKSIYVEEHEKDNITFYEGSKINPSSSSKLKRINLYKQLSSNQVASDNMDFKVKESALVEENIVNKDLYNIVMLSMDLMGIDKEVSFNIEGESLLVEGIINDESYKVSSIIYNEIKI